MTLETPAPDTDADPTVPAQAQTRLKIIDGDVHPALRSLADLKPYLSTQWWECLQSYGTRKRHGMNYEPYPKSAPRACRRDAWPEDGGVPGSSLELMRRQYLDAYGIEFGILGPLGVTGQGELNFGLAAALATATNAWQLQTFSRPEPRLKSGIVVPFEDSDASVREIERCADDCAFAQVFMLTRSCDPAGNHRYWPIYEAAARHGLPVALHVCRWSPLHRHRLAFLLHRGERGALDVLSDRRHQSGHRRGI